MKLTSVVGLKPELVVVVFCCFDVEMIYILCFRNATYTKAFSYQPLRYVDLSMLNSKVIYTNMV